MFEKKLCHRCEKDITTLKQNKCKTCKNIWCEDCTKLIGTGTGICKDCQEDKISDPNLYDIVIEGISKETMTLEKNLTEQSAKDKLEELWSKLKEGQPITKNSKNEIIILNGLCKIRIE
jgi:hypothetical protein